MEIKAMVDFNAETTVATPATDITRILILQYRDNAQGAIEAYIKARISGTDPPTSNLQSNVWSFWSQMKSALLRRHADNPAMIADLERTNNELRSTDMAAQDLIDIFDSLNDELDDWRLTRVDGRDVIDTLHVENENRAKKL